MSDPKDLAPRDPWQALARFTAARIAVGRTGASLPTAPSLSFALAHARARDAVRTPLDTAALTQQLAALHLQTETITSQARTRAEYLLRPDLGRQLAPEITLAPANTPHLLTILVADGLSAQAAQHHAIPLLEALLPMLGSWNLDTVFLATQARVALGDAHAQYRNSEAVLVLIGERPGLQAADSLSAYLTYAPHPGRTDAERNCVSNIRPAGLSYAEAAQTLIYLLNAARTLGLSGVALKDYRNPAKTDLPPHFREIM